MADQSWVCVASYGAVYEAEMAAGRLASAAIPSRLDQHGGVGLFGPGYGGRTVRGVDVLVPADYLGAAREALDLEE